MTSPCNSCRSSCCCCFASCMPVLAGFNFSFLVLGLILLTTTDPAHSMKEEDKQIENLSFLEKQAGSTPSPMDGEQANQDLQSQVSARTLVHAAVMKETLHVSRKFVKSRRQERLVSAVETPVYTRDVPSSTTDPDSMNAATHRHSSNHQNGIGFHRVQAETQKIDSTQKPSNAGDSGAFHVDYNGPRTHPPKNN